MYAEEREEDEEPIGGTENWTGFTQRSDGRAQIGKSKLEKRKRYPKRLQTDAQGSRDSVNNLHTT